MKLGLIGPFVLSWKGRPSCPSRRGPRGRRRSPLFVERESTSKSPFLKKIIAGLVAASTIGAIGQAQQVSQFAANPQHTNNYAVPAKNINQVLWQKNIDDNPSSFGHYGAPVITAAGTIITSHKTATNGFVVDAYDPSGNLIWTVTTDYVLPSYSWVPVYQPVLVGSRLYYAGVGGQVYYIDNVDLPGPHVASTVVFYGLANYLANPSGFNSTLFINTCLVADSAGDVFFGFRMQGTAPAPFNGNVGGLARIAAGGGSASYVLATDASGDASMLSCPHSMAPALSNDETTVYAYLRGSSDSNADLVGVDSTTLAPKFSVHMWDPRAPGVNGARVIDQSTASPMVGPDGDVYAPVFSNPYNGSRGFLLHFSGDLSVQKTTGAFGWDYTPGVVPASMVPSYHGPSSYLLFTKYNNYDITDGDGINRVALLDPNATQIDFHSTAPGLVEMREVLSVIGVTPDNGGASYPNATREWCINASAVNPATNSVLFNSEDGHTYRWNTVDNVLTQACKLNDGVGQPYVPTVIGPDGTVYTLNGGNLFALGDFSGTSFTVTSSAPNMRTGVVGDSITFTAKVNGGTGTPAGTFEFDDDTFNGQSPEHNVIAASVPVDASGQASVTLSTLSAGGAYFGNHFITATYSGDAGHSAGSGTMVQKVHAFSTSTAVSTGGPSNYGDPVTITANVTSGGGVPTGYVAFTDNGTVIGQRFLDGSGQAQFTTTSNLSVGTHTLGATYESDTFFASSTGTTSQSVGQSTSVSGGTSPNPSTFGQTVTFSATVTSNNGSAGIPTGSVAWMEGATTLATGTVDGSGNASATSSTLSVGSHNITVNFTGTNGWANSSASAGTQNVTATTSTAVSSSPNPSTYGSNVTFTATVTSAGGTPTGSVVFTIDGSAGSPVTVDGNGQATYSTTSLSVGSHTVSAAFTGTNGYGNSSGNGTNQSVTATTSTAVGSSPNPSSVGTSVTFTATVTSAGGTPTGSVVFTIDGSAGSPVTVNGSGQASYSTSSLSVGSHTVSAAFTGTGGYSNSSGNGSNQVVNAIATSTSVSSNLNPSVIGQSVTFTATVTSGSGTPTGSVTFKDGATTLATVTVDGTGHASTSTSSLSQGSHSITASFTATGNYANSTSSPLTQTVNADTTPPTVPQGVGATPGPGKGKITIAWQASTDPDDAVNHYEVWRSNKVNGTFNLIASPTTTSYVDNAGANKTMWYYVVAVDSHGNKSAASAKVTATAPARIVLAVTARG